MDNVNHPSHYGGKDNPYEVIKVIHAWGLGFDLGNALKYIARAGKKDPMKHLEDLEKARFYLNDEIERVTKSIVEKAETAKKSILKKAIESTSAHASNVAVSDPSVKIGVWVNPLIEDVPTPSIKDHEFHIHKQMNEEGFKGFETDANFNGQLS